ncbi:hypothetical protein FRC96_11520 [Lujinxingia vulgaris]|uniref:Uncharacterized protein n=1 Tax=Lujinxingia vulgaris TaxID=2600176 RepID=A0A5C6X4Z1_9DELT|nr:hypothetical protein [Lujinxingia vulgaris]TXD35297.1 hypothetical protein FRC96_11520 [Lujinxingia vulgaris]
MDRQCVEIIGRNILVDQLLRAGLEVAQPLRDRGIDLLVYSDLSEDGPDFQARPIQMKASSERRFGIDRKYQKFADLLIVHVWNVRCEDETLVYATTFEEAVRIGDEMGWTTTKSWVEHNAYSTSAPSKRLQTLLAPYAMTSERWRAKLGIVAREPVA